MVSLKHSVWFFDVDDTLITTDKTLEPASVHVKEVLQPIFGDIAGEIQQRFSEYFNLLRKGYRAVTVDDWKRVPGRKVAFDILYSRIKSALSAVFKNCGFIKPWSREVLLFLAAQDMKVAINPSLLDAAVSAYWQGVSENIEIIPGALFLFQKLHSLNVPIFLLTSSDGRLQVSKKSFSYNPDYSSNLKRKRLDILKQKGLSYAEAIIGDPDDKPEVKFFERAIRCVSSYLEKQTNPSAAVMVGDSYKLDIATPREILKFGLTVLCNPLQKNEVVDSSHVTVNDLAFLPRFYSDLH